MRILTVQVCVTALLAFVACPAPMFATLGNDGGLDPTQEDTIVAGVQFGVPPSAKGSADSHGCTWVPAGEAGTFEVGVVDVRVVDGVTQRLFLRSCPTSTVGVWVSQVSSTRLAASGSSVVKERLPKPVLGSAPGVADGVVKLGMWLWADAAQYRPVSVVAWVPTLSGISWVRTTATPVGMVFEPGEPNGVPVRCTGPGEVWQHSDGDQATSSCMYTYAHSSEIAGGHFAGTWSMVWHIAWRSNVGVQGDLGEYVTSSDVDVVVREIQAVIVN